ncbi:MAG: hypothetical protein QTN59_00830 [Candidatus Electrothrix communis]|nr:MAG: hypothetical protein QTN59_00830 [Candidatus Electrothrix communis]
MVPHKQGGLDGLCGVYSIINALKLVNEYSNEESQENFNKIIRYLDSERNLSKLIINGLDINLIGQVMNNVQDLGIVKEQPFKGKGETSLSEFWTAMQYFLNEPYRAILLGLSGVHDHWTVVQSISDKQLQLLDSDGLKKLNRSACTTQFATKSRKHVVYPTHTYFLSSSL